MRIAVAALLTALAVSHPAIAGGPVEVADEPAAPAPSIFDWSGAYAGLGFGTTSASFDVGPLAAPPLPAEIRDLTDGSAAAIHLGYLFQRGAFVFGPELAYTKFSDTGFELSPEEEVDRTIDLKARLGYAANRVFVFGVLGYSRIDFAEGPDDGFSVNGPSFGLGVDIATSDRLVFGIEYLARRTSGRFDPPGRDYDLNVDTLSVRLSYRF